MVGSSGDLRAASAAAVGRSGSGRTRGRVDAAGGGVNGRMLYALCMIGVKCLSIRYEVGQNRTDTRSEVTTALTRSAVRL